MQTIERVRGMLDAPPDDARRLDALVAELLRLFGGYGYRPVHVPVVEFAELFLRKSGADVSARMYTFTDQSGRRLALRPEMTAPVLRSFLQLPEPAPLPARLAYAGPVFRYEKPQRGRYRQFIQAGVELIGAEPPFADAELLAMSMEVPALLGLQNVRVVIGHLGIVLAFLAALEVDGRTEAVLLQSLETLKKGQEGAQALRRLLRLEAEPGDGLGDATPLAIPPQDDPNVQRVLATLPRDDAVLLVRSLLGSINTSFGGGREPDEIIDRLVERLASGDQRAKAERAVAFIMELSGLAGPRDDALRKAGELIRRYQLPSGPLRELERICEVLDQLGCDWSQVTIDLSLGRGLQYYTGLVFEVYGSGLGAEGQLCGGGRYDGLATALGSKQALPALGCSWGLERLALLVGDRAVSDPWLDALVVPTGGSFAYASAVARELRNHRLRVEVEVRARSVRAAIGFAARRGARWVVMAGEREQGEQAVTLRHLASADERVVPLATIQSQGLPEEQAG